jgi:wobble nucleotide-excising tRNase
MSSEVLKEKIVVIDDPVSSMDSTALFLVSAIVREMINVCRNNTEYLNPKVRATISSSCSS